MGPGHARFALHGAIEAAAHQVSAAAAAAAVAAAARAPLHRRCREEARAWSVGGFSERTDIGARINTYEIRT